MIIENEDAYKVEVVNMTPHKFNVHVVTKSQRVKHVGEGEALFVEAIEVRLEPLPSEQEAQARVRLENGIPDSALVCAARDLLASCNRQYAMYGPGRRLAQMVLGLPVEKDE